MFKIKKLNPTGTVRRRFRTRFKTLAVGVAVAMTAAVSACSGSGSSQADNEITYWLWDASQQPGYQKCADAFHQQNPKLNVKITQYGWGDYWTKLTAGFISGTAPDVFTNHLTKYPQFVDLNVLLPLDQLQATRDISDDEFQPGLGELWSKDGHRYGSPKDWDTVGLFYNTQLLQKAGVDPAELGKLDWNTKDGGSFEKLIAHLTVDNKGRRGDEKGFDKNHVAVYGLGGLGAGDNMAQTTWSSFAVSNGWQFMDKNPWGTHYNYGDQKLQDTLSWYFGLARKGYAPKYGTFSDSFGAYNQFAAGKAAIVEDGAWMISSYQTIKDIKWQIAPMPIGPSGKRAAPFNGLADSVTKFAKNPENAAKWVKFLSTEQCQDLIGKAGVVFPARPQATGISLQTRKAAGVDASAFTDTVANKETFFLPVSSYGADIAAIMTPGLEAIFIGEQPVSSLVDLNNQVNRLFEFG
ncbi:sugar ABC transporter substrate-binding protein [Microlunatus elymi]|uniref:Sugar ABC transporter substrate-binding protein n=1 Tax=Microlunatus elymi TaxID=2596828 RepID=A0A516PYF0_9ACTN|nr:sugar ABC transporter substrate-binding protein [Microlunatus elymi]QDP96209.1 sugar ABC transporter substrate-binding protein [Microlunatus elymi]